MEETQKPGIDSLYLSTESDSSIYLNIEDKKSEIPYKGVYEHLVSKLK